MASRLLTTPTVARRRIESDADEWSVRLAAFAALGHYDALTFVVDGPARTRYGHNVIDDPLVDVATHTAFEEARRSGSTVQTQTAIRLADDRVASGAMVAPLVATEDVSADRFSDSRVAPVARLVQRFVDACERGGSPSPGFAEGYRVQGLIDAARQAHASGRWIDVAPPAGKGRS